MRAQNGEILFDDRRWYIMEVDEYPGKSTADKYFRGTHFYISHNGLELWFGFLGHK